MHKATGYKGTDEELAEFFISYAKTGDDMTITSTFCKLIGERLNNLLYKVEASRGKYPQLAEEFEKNKNK